ncbi:MAG: BMP family ABC transporter substrate-binding protein, partial [Acidimicrobiia bacterium]|nr:BMP family ABC transporter substrate-binding protein [Acidimicrobiia bacterium]
AGASGSDDLAGLERRVEFEVDSAAGAPVPDSRETLRIALVAPSASNDLAFTQSMVDAINVIAAERGNVEVDITDNTFVPAEAADAIRSYAAADYDLIIAHGVEFGNELRAIVTDNPGVTFGWGTASDTFGLPNLYAYDAAAEEGGYVMGAMSAMLSTSDVIGVVGPIQVADAERYIDGFDAGVRAQAPSSKVLIEYTGSFADITLAAEVAERHVGAGADVMTGTAEMVVGAVSVASEHDVLWFGTQASQAPMAPNIVVASQVYHWEVALRPIVADIDAGTREGRSYLAQLSNGGLVIELNPDYQLPVDVRQRANDITADIISGRIRP